MNNGKQSEQLLKVLGGHSASLGRTSKCRGLSEQPLYSGGHKATQHETRNWNNFDKCEPEQQYRLGTVSYKKNWGGGLKKSTSRQRSGKGAIRKRFPLQKPRWEKNKLTIRYLYHENIS